MRFRRKTVNSLEKSFSPTIQHENNLVSHVPDLYTRGEETALELIQLTPLERCKGKNMELDSY